MNFLCLCLTEDYSGRFCEYRSTSLQVAQATRRSLGYIAIVSICFVVLLILSLDGARYLFGIDPSGNQQRAKQLRKTRRQRDVRERKKEKSNVKTAIRFVYMHEEEI
ncbi:unnamed protein product [Didymodactylos carnosus]|nr:unnamed protein product [Didymodactylos carnosus]CAF4301652.1 unnamed protein product [Didymodactylos carnosus]